MVVAIDRNCLGDKFNVAVDIAMLSLSTIHSCDQTYLDWNLQEEFIVSPSIETLEYPRGGWLYNLEARRVILHRAPWFGEEG